MGGVKYLPLDTVVWVLQFFIMKWYLFSFLSTNYGDITVVKLSQFVYQNAVHCKFSLCLGVDTYMYIYRKFAFSTPKECLVPLALQQTLLTVITVQISLQIHTSFPYFLLA